MRRALAAALVPVALAVVAAVPGTGSAKASAGVKGSLQQAYVGQRYLGPAKKAQQNKAARYDGPPLVLQAAYIGRAAAEPTIGVDAKGVAFMTASAFDSVATTPAASVPRTEVRGSTDGGKTWANVSPTAPVVKTLPPVTLDPMLWLDKSTGRLFNPELTVEGAYLQFTDDEGKNWTTSPLCCGNPADDHQTFVGGPPPAGGVPTVNYPNVLYYCFNQVADSPCSKSLDGGLTWLPTGTPPYNGACPTGGGHTANGYSSSSIEGHAVVDKRGWLWVPYGHCGKPYLALSKDEGVTWTTILVSESFGTATDAGLGQNHLAVDVDAAGTVYFLWWTADTLPLLASSKDGGAHWSAPVLVAPPGVRSVNFPMIAAGKKGQVAIIFPGAAHRYDYSAKPNGDRSLPWNLYVVTSLNADSKNPLFVSATANPPKDPIHRGACEGRCGGMYDFLDVKYAPSGAIWVAGVDTCTKVKECSTTKDEDVNLAVDGQGLAIRQLSGPGLKAPKAKSGSAVRLPGIPARTGGAAGLAAAALLGAAGAVALRTRVATSRRVLAS